MNTNVNLAAPLGVLALLGTALVITVAVICLLDSLIVSRAAHGLLARLSMLTILIVGGLYLGALLVFAFASSDKVLARGSEKHFCEIDCHLAYSIVDVKPTKTIGNGPQQVSAAGLFNVVTIKTRFDETTISAHRGNGQLYPNSRTLSVIDDRGRQYLPATLAQKALELSGAAGAPLTTPLRPGESYTTSVVFDLPADAKNPTLLLNEGDWLTHLVIGHENSPLHKQTRFQL